MKIKYFILSVAIYFSFMIGVHAATNPYVPTTQWGINCTYNTWQQVYNRLGIALPGWGNASTWYDYAKKAGYEVGQVPRNNSIVVWNWESDGINYGHVTFVEEAKGDKIYVWESNSGCKDETPEYYTCLETIESPAPYRDCEKYLGKAHGCEKNAAYWHEPGDLIGYIYLDKVPTKPTSTPSSKPVASTKSSNAFLKSVTISNINFKFDKNTLKYDLEVAHDTIQIEVQVEDQKAQVEGAKEYQLDVGENLISIIVTAENGSKKTYEFNITRKDNNANIKTLQISNVEFSYNQDLLEYQFDVKEETDTIYIEATLESEFATIEGVGNHSLKMGENIIQLIVTAEDNTKKTTTLKINRGKEKEETNTQIKEDNVKKDKKHIVIYLSIGGIIILIIILIFIILVKQKKKALYKNRKVR